MATPKTPKARKADKPHIWLSDELKTSLVAEAKWCPDPRALCAKYSVSKRTLERARTEVSRDAQLQAVVAEKEKLHAEVWGVGIRETARDLFNALQHHARLALQATAFSGDMVHKLAGALKVLNDAAALRSMVKPDGRVQDNRSSQAAGKNPAMGARAGSGGTPGGTGTGTAGDGTSGTTEPAGVH